MKTPYFIEKIDWSELRNQKRFLLKMESNVNGEDLGNLEGIINLIDAIQDYAVDEMGINENDVFDFEQEEDREKETPELKFVRESADNIYMELCESDGFHFYENIPTEFIEKIMTDDEAIIKGLLRTRILGDLKENPQAFQYKNNKPIYDNNMREDFEFVATDYIRNIFKSYKQVWICSNCGSTNVQTKMWVDLNTNVVGNSVSDGEDEDNYCPDCDGHHPVELKFVKK